MDKIVIIMPTYNEGKNIGRMIDELVGKEFPQIEGADMHLLVVDDNSPDGTGDIVREKIKTFNRVHLIQGEKAGLGTAYIRGMKYAVAKLGADAVMEMDADFQHPPKYVKDMVKAYLDGADYVIGSRYVPGGSVPSEWALFRKAVSYFGNLYIRIVLMKFSIHDLTTGFRLTRVKGVLDKIDLDNIKEQKRFAYKVDLLYQSIKNAKKVVEVPFHFAPRIEEQSKFSMKEMISTFKLATILGIKDKQRLIKFAVVGFTGFMVNYIGLELLKRAGLSTYFATLVATELAIISNFIFNNIWTFKDKTITKAKDIVVQFAKFNLSSLFAVVFQPLVVAGAVRIFPDTSLVRFLALVFALIFVMIYNYTVYNLFIWKTWKLPFLSKFQKASTK